MLKDHGHPDRESTYAVPRPTINFGKDDNFQLTTNFFFFFFFKKEERPPRMWAPPLSLKK